jgi:UDP-3-O-[3-hydroxymyristoyl] glucosamine N-acyltransferase
MLKFTLEQVAQMLGGTVEGNPHAEVFTIAKIQEAQEGSIAFLANPKYEPFIYTTQATAVIVNQDFEPKQALHTNLIRVKDAYLAFTRLLEQYQQLKQDAQQGIAANAHIEEGSWLGEGVYVAPFVYIGKNVRIGKHVKIYPHTFIGDNVSIDDHTVIHAGVKIYEGCVIGKHCVIHAGAVIGSEGFGFAPQEDGSYRPIPQVGIVELEDYVRVGANTTIDRATLGKTLVKQGAKLDNLIQVAHNVIIGKHTVIAAQTGIAGSTEIGNHCMIGGQVGFVGHIKVADKTIIGAQSGILDTISEEGGKWQGSPAMPMSKYYRVQAVLRKLPELWRKLNQLS